MGSISVAETLLDMSCPLAGARQSTKGEVGNCNGDDLWEVVGGSGKGGIIVRRGKELSSPLETCRLGTGALIRQLALEDGRLLYERLVGTGPMNGWVSVKLSSKDLIVRTRPRPKVDAIWSASPPADTQKIDHARSEILSRARLSQDLNGEVAPQRPPEVEPPSGDVNASLQYLDHDGRQPFIYMYEREDGGEQMHLNFERRLMTIEDGRAVAAGLSLDEHGVLLVPHSTELSNQDFYERQELVWGKYYDEMKKLVQQATGASKVVVFDHNIRNPDAKWRRGVIGYVPYAHNDYTVESAPKRVQDCAGMCDDDATSRGRSLGSSPVLFDDEVQQMLRQRYVIINVWRNISETPIAADPLAVADGRTIHAENYVPSDLIYRDRKGQTYSVTHDQGHRWLYFSGMRKNEAILLKCFDSEERHGVVRWTAHTGFHDPRAPPEAPVRESIDARCIAFFSDGDVERTALQAAALFPGAF